MVSWEAKEPTCMTAPDDDKPPFGVSTRRIGDRLIVTRRWWSLCRLMAGPFGIAAIWIAALRLGSSSASGQAIDRSVAILIVGAVMTYVFLTGLINRTTIVVDPGFLRITAGPLPALSMRHVQAPPLKRISLRKKTAHVYTSVLSFCDLDGVLRDGSDIRLDRIEWAEKKAQWIHERMKHHLSGV
jgi:hypothetical protein